jgi:hypothetical protein
VGRPGSERPAVPKFSEELERWLRSDQPTLSRLIEVLGPRSFAAIFLVLMAVPALPIPTGGATHVLEVIVMLIAVQLIAGRHEIWLPERWQRVELAGSGSRHRFAEALLRRVRWLERHSRPRGGRLLERQPIRSLYGLAVLALSLTAFLAPPFSGLDTIPSLGVVVMSVGVLLGDLVLALAGLLVGATGALIVVLLGDLIIRALGGLF